MRKALQPYYCQKYFIEQQTKQDDSSLLNTEEVESKRRKLTARRAFAQIWSALRHPIHWLIEITDENQRLQLRPEIYELIQERIVTSRSKLSNQHQGHDAIFK